MKIAYTYNTIKSGKGGEKVDEKQKSTHTEYKSVPTQYTVNNGQQGYGQEIQSTEGQGYGIASLSLGIIGLFLSCCIPIIGFILPVLAIVFGVLGMKYPSGKGMAIAGLVLGCIGIIPALFIMFAFVVSW